MRIRHVLFVASATCIALPSALFAQSGNSSPRKTSYGLLVGSNIASISDLDEGTDESFKKKRRVGFDAGIFASIPLGEMLSLQPEVHYAQKGLTIEGKGEVDGSFGVKLDYLEVPVLLRLDAGKSSAIHPFFLAGASAAYRLRCQLSLRIEGTSVTEDCDSGTSDIEDVFKKSDFGVVGGAGLAMNAGARAVSLQVRFTQGLSSISKTPDAVVTDGGPVSTSKPKNQTIGILLGISF